MNVPILSKRRELSRRRVEDAAMQKALGAVEEAVGWATGGASKSFGPQMGNTGLGGAATMLSAKANSGVPAHPGTSWSNQGGLQNALIARVTQNLASGFARAPEELELSLAEQGLSWGPPFAPGRPLDPFWGYRRPPRTWDYPVGTNVQLTPRQGRLSFQALESLWEAYDVAQVATMHLINDVRSLDYNWEPIPGIKADVSGDIEEAIAFFDSPDKRQPFRAWLAEYLEDVIKFDAGALYIRRNEAGDPIALEVVSGSSIIPLVDFFGRRPEDEEDEHAEPEDLFGGEIVPAYVQIIEGLPWDWLAADDLIYQAWNPQPKSQYGRAPLERVMLSANCFSADTEVLTRRGWLTFPEVDIAGDEIATRDPQTQAFEWQQATKFYEAQNEEPLYHFTAKSVDMLVTAGHRMLVDRCPKDCPSAERWGDGWRIQAEDLARVPYSTGVRMLLTSEWDAPDLEVFQLAPEYPNKKGFTELGGDDFAAFMGMWLAEGSCAYEPGRRNDIWISQLPSSKGFAAYSALLERLLGEPCRHDGKRFVFHNSALASYLKQFGGATEKYVPDEILNLSRRQLELFWEHYFLGDGCDRGSVPTITTSSKRMADHLQEVAQKTGAAASVRQLAPAAPGRVYEGHLVRENAPRWQITLTAATTRRFHVERVEHSGTVYCVSVPNRVIYVRRNGHALWCGQTDIRFQWHFLQYFTEGSIPAGFMEAAPDQSDPAQIAHWQEVWDAIMVGDQAKQTQVRWVPNGSKFTATKDDANKFDKDFPLYLLRRTCAAHGVTPSDIGFVEEVNKATGDTQIDVQFRVGTAPLLRHVEDVINLFVKQHLKLRCRINFDDGKETEDRVATATADKIYTEAGVKSVDEVRQGLGLHVDKSRPMPRYINNTRSGPIPLLALESMAGEIDPETYGPSDSQEPVSTPFAPPPGAIAPAGSPEQLAAAENTAQQARNLVEATTGELNPADPALKPQPAAAGEGESEEDEGGEGEAEKARVDYRDVLRLLDEVEKAHDNTGGPGVSRGFSDPKLQPVSTGLATHGSPTTTFGGTDGLTVRGPVTNLLSDDDDDDDETGAAKAELVALAMRRWRSNSRNRLKKGQAPRRFTDPNLPSDLHDDVWAKLSQARSRQEVDAAFADVGKPSAGERPAFAEGGIVSGPVIIGDGSPEAYIVPPSHPLAAKAKRPVFHHNADAIVAHYAPQIAKALGKLFTQADIDAAISAAQSAKEPVEKSAGPPPNLREHETSLRRCINCCLFNHPVCVKYGDWPVRPDQTCDGWELAIDDQPVEKAKADPVKEAVIKALEGKASTAELEKIIEELYGDSMLQGAHDAAHAAGGTIVASLKDVSEQAPKDYWDQWTPGFGRAAADAADGGMREMLEAADITISGMSDTTIDKIGTAVSEGLSRGDSIATTRKAIEDTVQDPARGELIVNTEYARAMTTASEQTYRELGVEEEEWMSEATACAECEENQDASPIKVGEDWPNGSVPVHPACRCSQAPYVDLGTPEGG